MKYRIGIAVVAFLTMTSIVAADDFWLVPNAFSVTPGSALTIRGQTSSNFPASKSAVAVDRIASAARISSAGSVALTDLSVAGRSLMLRDRPTAAGQYVIGVSIHPRSLRESTPGFLRYLGLEGADSVLARVQRTRALDGRDSVTRRYAKYAKTLVQVGTAGPRAFDRLAGHAIEFVPLRDPSTLKVGDTLQVRALFRGSPLAGLPVHADVVDPATDRDAPAAAGHSASAFPVQNSITDAAGIARFSVRRAGMWSVRSVHIEEVAGSGASLWDVHWVSLVFLAGIR